MKAVVCREHGLPDRLDLVDDWPSPELGDDDVRIRVKAAGLNFPDVLIIQGKYQFQPELPFIPGGECAGVVEEVGAAVTRWKVGEEVIHSGGSGSLCEEIVANEQVVTTVLAEEEAQFNKTIDKGLKVGFRIFTAHI